MLYIIIPTYNEADNIAKLVQAIMAQPLPPLRILIVDDNSPDGTGQIADSLAQKHPEVVKVLHRPGKLGIGSAYITGFKKALAEGAEFIMEMDADFSHDPADIPRLVSEVQSGFDFVIGSRRVKGGEIVGWGPGRKLMSRGAMDFSRIMLGLKTKDVTAGFRCLSRSFLLQLPLDEINSNGYSFQEELIFYAERMGAKIKEIPVTFLDRRFGKSKLSVGEIVKFFYNILRLKWLEISGQFNKIKNGK